MFARLMGLKTILPASLHDLMKTNDVAVIDVIFVSMVAYRRTQLRFQEEPRGSA
jgi:hypothetical protein